MKRLLLVLLIACNGAQESGPLQGTLELEIRDSLQVTLEQTGSRVTLVPSAGYGVMAPGVALSGDGRLERFAEANGSLYTAKLSAPADPSGPCASEPVSLALALHRQGNNARVMGALTAYCGAGRWHGVPVRVLRVAGALPLGP